MSAVPFPGTRDYSVAGPEFIDMTFPIRADILSPVIKERSLVMLHGPRGVGKSFAALSIFCAAASGGKALGRWDCVNPVPCLYVDGELPGEQLQSMFKAISFENGVNLDNVHVVTNDTLPDIDTMMPDVSIMKGQRIIEHIIEKHGIKLLIIDNLVSLARLRKENDAESWTPVQDWLIRLRRLGVSVLIVHHDGKSGEQRGTSAKEDLLDVILHMKKAEDTLDTDGARADIIHSKHRYYYGDDARSFRAILNRQGDGVMWTSADLNGEEDDVRELLAEGKSLRAIAAETGISKSRVGRIAAALGR
jgi:putative DNA primase/helicase